MDRRSSQPAARPIFKSTDIACLRLNSCKVVVESQGKDKSFSGRKVLRATRAKRGPEVDYTLLHTFFNDGVVVTAVKLTPQADLRRRGGDSCIGFRRDGQFSHYLHKNRDEHGDAAARGRLPEAGQALRLATLTSCLQVFSPTAALAIFTDGGALHVSQPKLDTAVAEVAGREDRQTQVSLAQYLVHVARGDKPYVLKAGEPFTFRVGISVAPNRLPHPRLHDLRMFTWIGDEKYPYPTDEEIATVAQLGFTLFQMHRVGTPGEPRPPAGEFDRVIRKVHELGMLFLWEENADLLYASAPGVLDMKAKGQWPLWQGFNYGGRYRATMDPYLRHAGHVPGLAQRPGRIPPRQHCPHAGPLPRGWDLPGRQPALRQLHALARARPSAARSMTA